MSIISGVLYNGMKYVPVVKTNFVFQEQIYTGTDISILLKEIQKAQDVINKIKDMRQGMMGSALISIMNEVSSVLNKIIWPLSEHTKMSLNWF